MKKFHEMIDLYADLSEIGQSGTLRFAFATIEDGDVIRAQTLFVKCRDFLTDTVVGSAGGYQTPRIYGFTYDGENDPLDSDKTRLVLRLSTAKEQLALVTNKGKLNNMFVNAGVERTTVQEIEPEGATSAMSAKYYLVEGDVRWSKHPLSISFYTLLLRVITSQVIPNDISLVQFMKEVSYHSYNDWSYLKSFWKVFDHPNDFIKKMDLFDLRDVHDSVRAEDEMDHVHNHGGIQTFCELIHYSKTNSLSDYLEIDYDYEEEGSDNYDEEEARLIYPTLSQVEHFV